MTINNFTPNLWAGRALANLNDAHVYGNALNRDYEGEIKQMGDRLRIQSIGRVTIRTYTKNTTITAPETLQDSEQILIIDQGDYFNFAIDDVDAAQNKITVMDEAMRDSAWGLSDVADAYLASLLEAGTATANILTALTSVGDDVTDDDAYKAIVDLDIKLNENNVPRDGKRFVIVPPWFEGILRLDQRFVSFGTATNVEQLRGKPIGAVSGFSVWVSNNVPVSGSAYTLIAGHPIAATYAEQISEIKAYEPPDRFADAVKGLHIYGATVTRPYALARVAVTEAT